MMNIIRLDENCIFRYFPLFSEFARELTHPVSCVSKGHSPFHRFLDARINISKVYKFNEFPKSMEFYENVFVQFFTYWISFVVSLIGFENVRFQVSSSEGLLMTFSYRFFPGQPFILTVNLTLVPAFEILFLLSYE